MRPCMPPSRRETVPTAKDTHTPASSIRIPEDVKKAAKARADAEGRTLTDVVVAHLRRYGAAYRDR